MAFRYLEVQPVERHFCAQHLFSFSILLAVSFGFVSAAALAVNYIAYTQRGPPARLAAAGGTFNPFRGMTTFAFASGCCSLPNAYSDAGLCHFHFSCNRNCLWGHCAWLTCRLHDDDVCADARQVECQCNLLQVKNFHSSITTHTEVAGGRNRVVRWLGF